jgi:hypothetical protein
MPQLDTPEAPAVNTTPASNGQQPNAKGGGKGGGKPPTKPRASTLTMPARPVLYPDIQINGVTIPRERLRVTKAKAKKLLEWESEPEYAARVGRADAKIPEEHRLLRDTSQDWVACFNNCRNRPFTEAHAKTIAQEILNGRWELNLETIIISRTGIILSGQHRLVGFVLACEMWAKQFTHWKTRWPEEPYIEALVAVGGSEDANVIMTLDNVRPRSEADVIYTSDVYAALGQADRRECRLPRYRNRLPLETNGAGGREYVGEIPDPPH